MVLVVDDPQEFQPSLVIVAACEPLARDQLALSVECFVREREEAGKLTVPTFRSAATIVLQAGKLASKVDAFEEIDTLKLHLHLGHENVGRRLRHRPPWFLAAA